jgi:hypothetical protein
VFFLLCLFSSFVLWSSLPVVNSSFLIALSVLSSAFFSLYVPSMLSLTYPMRSQHVILSLSLM